MIHSLRLLLPCHSLEDFPTYHTGEDAENLLVAWTLPWHPAWLDRAGKLPEWTRVENIPDSCAGVAFLVPRVSQARLPSGFRDRCQQQGGLLFDLPTDREEAFTQLLARVNQLEQEPPQEPIAPSLESTQVTAPEANTPAADTPQASDREAGDREAGDLDVGVSSGASSARSTVPGPLGSCPPEVAQRFFALGYTYLQVELLTRQLRYTSNLDQAHFQTLVLQAANAALRSDDAALDEALGRCFDLLSEERHRYYPMPSLLCDLTLLAPSTLSNANPTPPVPARGDQRLPVNWLISADLLCRLRAGQPSRWAEFQAAVAAGEIHLVSSGYNQAPTGLLSHETLRRNLAWGQAALSHLVGQPARVFGRRLPGLELTLPGLLPRFGFRSALHQALDGERLPQTSHTYLRWQGLDGETLPALTKTIYDAAEANTFLKLGVRIGEALDVDHVAASQFVHWPGPSSVGYRDLLLAAQEGDALGRWCQIEDLIGQINDPGYSPSLSSYDYQAGYLKQLLADLPKSADVAGPLAEVRELIHRESQLRRASLLSGLTQLAMADRTPAKTTESVDPVEPWTATDDDRAALTTAEHGLAMWQQLLGSAERIAEREQLEATTLVQTLTEAGDQCRLLVNPEAHSRRVLLSPSDLGRCHPGALPPDQVYATYRDRQGWWAVVDVPPLGYLHFSNSAGAKQKIGRQPRVKLVAGGTTLRNEFLSASIDPQTGALRSIHDYQSRGNLCSLQLAWFDQSIKSTIEKLWRKPTGVDWKAGLSQLLGGGDPDGLRRQLAPHAEGYSAMQAQKVEVVTNHPLHGHIRSQGQLHLAGKVIAKFVIDYKLTLGSRFLEIACQLTPTSKPKTVPWTEEQNYEFPPTDELTGSGFRRYFAWRFAQAHPSAEVYRDMNSMAVEATRPTTVAPRWLEFRGVDQSLAWLTGGSAFHRIPADGRVDTLVGLSPTTPSTSTVAIGLSPPNLAAAADSQLLPSICLPSGPLRTGLPTGAWLFRCSSRNIVVTHWENRYADERWIGVRLRLLETSGRSRKFKLEFAGRPTAVRVVLPPGAEPSLTQSRPDCQLVGEQIECRLSPCEHAELEVDF